jgi:type I restriction enzyme R subunit
VAQAAVRIDPGVLELRKTSANFGFLVPHEPLLVLYGAGAEATVFDDPNVALIKGRQFGEVLAQTLVRDFGIRLQTDDQVTRIKALSRVGVLDNRLTRVFDELRQLGNKAVHANLADQDKAFRAVYLCFVLGVWFFRWRTGNREPMAFVPPQPKVPAAQQSDELQQALAQARIDLQLAREKHTDEIRSQDQVRREAHLAAAVEIATAARERDRLAEVVSSLSSEIDRLKTSFDSRKAPKSLSTSARQTLLENARRAAQEPLSENQVRLKLDDMLGKAGWAVQDSKGQQDLYAARGVAVREVTTAAGRADYFLYVDRQLVGVVEAKKEGADLSAAQEQADGYATTLTAQQRLVARWHPLPYRFACDGNTLRFRNQHDPNSRTREIFSFPQPTTVGRWMREADVEPSAQTYRARLRQLLDELRSDHPHAANLRPAQLEAVRSLEDSLRHDQPRALIQMATGAGKTYAAVTASYRLLKYAKAQRILFLVDRNNLGEQALGEFINFTTPDDGRKFTELYNVDILSGSAPYDSSKVVISTIQRLAKLLSRESLPDDTENDDPSAFEEDERDPDPTPVRVEYNPLVPPEAFDLIIIDECHRSIYGKWREVLEYFDAHLVGLTATPVAQTFAFFHGNLISEYTYEQAVADGVAVDYLTYRINTEITEQGAKLVAGTQVKIRDRQTRRKRYEELDQDFVYGASQVGTKVIAESQLRALMGQFRSDLWTIFPERQRVPVEQRMVPKTLIFARDDNHAEEIVRVVREVFGMGDDFCSKITAKATQPKPREGLATFRNAPDLRIAVTVDMIATGTDVRAIECVFFLRDVKSWAYFEQMRGRGARTISSTELRAVSPDVDEKTRFVVIDAIGVTDSHKRETPVVEKDDAKRSSLKRLLGRTASGEIDEDQAEELAIRLARLSRILTDGDQRDIYDVAGETLDSIVGRIQRTVDVNNLANVRDRAGAAEGDKAVHRAVRAAVEPLAKNPDLRSLLLVIRTDRTILYDEVSPDAVTHAGFVEKPDVVITSWRAYLNEHRADILALQLAFTKGNPQGVRPREAYRQLKELASRIARPPQRWTPQNLWKAYADLQQAAAAPGVRLGLPDLISLIRYELGLDSELRPYRSVIEDRYANWLARQQQAGARFTHDQRWWLDRIVDTVATSVRFDETYLDHIPFTERGGTDGFLNAFDQRAESILTELDQELAA